MISISTHYFNFINIVLTIYFKFPLSRNTFLNMLTVLFLCVSLLYSQAELLVADGTSSACVVLWNTLCLDWYRTLQPGQVVKLSHYRVKESFSSRSGQESEPHIGM